jgi:hypothetical protein
MAAVPEEVAQVTEPLHPRAEVLSQVIRQFCQVEWGNADIQHAHSPQQKDILHLNSEATIMQGTMAARGMLLQSRILLYR